MLFMIGNSPNLAHQHWDNLGQHAKKVVSDILGLAYLASGLWILFLTCPTSELNFLGEFKLQNYQDKLFIKWGTMRIAGVFKAELS